MKMNQCFKKCLFSFLLLFLSFLCFSQPAFAAKRPATVRKLTCGSTTRNSINISWASQNGVTGYQVFRSLSYDGPYEKIKEVTAGNHAFCNLKLQNGREYYYRVRAYIGKGSRIVTGNFSKPLSARTRCPSHSANVRGSINVRKHAGINHPVIAIVNAGSKVTVICTANDKPGAAWSRISFKAGNKKKYGYVRSDLLSTGQTQKRIGVVTAGSGLRLRRSADISSRIVTTLSKGTKVTILGQVTGSDRQKWYLISVKQGRKTLKGYASARYISVS